MGGVMHGLRMELSKQDPKTSAHYCPEFNAVPRLAELGKWARLRAQRRAVGGRGCPTIAESVDTAGPSGRGSKSHTVYDDDESPGQTRFEGPGKKVSARSSEANLILKTIGFHLYVHSERNIRMNRSGSWERAFVWPAHQHIKPFRGTATRERPRDQQTLIPVS
jgi:hypothetical protein